jgi:tRNA G18 (ribose-2'-O)-methylase SpoU
MLYRARKCESPDCGLRFPVEDGSPLGASCPVCGGPTHFVDEPYPTHTVDEISDEHDPRLEVLLDNVRSLRNVGSMFRTADGVGVRHMHLGGFTPTPDHPKLVKTSLGAERSVAWSHHPDPVSAAEDLHAQGKRLWALEGGDAAGSLFSTSLEPAIWRNSEIVLVVGHEVSGIDPRICERCERVLRIPMVGVKGSLNVGVAFGVAAYWIRYGLPALAAAGSASGDQKSREA